MICALILPVMTVATVHPPLLHHYVDCRRCGVPSSGMNPPDALRAEIELQNLELISETATDGNCGVHAFALGLSEAAQYHRPLYVTNQFKQFSKTRRDTNRMIHYLRQVARQWFEK